MLCLSIADTLKTSVWKTHNEITGSTERDHSHRVVGLGI